MKAEDLESHLRTLLDEIDTELAPEKNRQFHRLDKCDKYNRSLQYVAPVENDAGGWEYTSVGTPLASRDGEEDLEGQGLYDYNINVLETYGRRWTAVLGSRPFWALKAVPDDPQSEDDRKAARQAEIAKLWLHSTWKVETKNIRIAQNQWRTGTPWLYTPAAADKEEFGTTVEPVMKEQEVPFGEGGYDCFNCGDFSPELAVDELTEETVCPGCSYPMDTNSYSPPETVTAQVEVGSEEYENVGAELYVCNGFNVTVHFHAQDMKRLPVLLYEYEDYKGTLLSIYPELRESMDDQGLVSGGREDSQVHDSSTRSSRESLIGQRSVSENRWTHARYWLHPDTLELVEDDDARKHLLKTYPDGLRVTVVGGKILLERLEGEAAHDVWTPILPYANDYLYTDPVSFSLLGHQDILNDCWNMAIEHLERGLPTTIAESGVLDLEAINERRMLPNEIIETLGTVGGALDSKIKTLPTARFPAQLIVIIEGIEKAIQAQTGLNPAVFGQLSEGRKTAEEYRLSLNQALQQLGPPGEYLKLGWVMATTNAIKQLERHAPKNINVSVSQGGETVSEMLDFEALRAGNWHFESVHAGVPQTFADERDAVQQLVKESPDFAASIGVNQPVNVGWVKDHFGVSGLKTPMEALRQKILDTIQQLLEDGLNGAGPVEEQMVDGSVMELPSVPPEEFVDDYQVVAQMVKEWMVDAAGQKAKTANPAGYANVRAYGKAQKRAAQMEAMQAQPPPAPGKENGKGPPRELAGPPEQAPQGIEGAPGQGESPTGEPVNPAVMTPAEPGQLQPVN